MSRLLLCLFFLGSFGFAASSPLHASPLPSLRSHTDARPFQLTTLPHSTQIAKPSLSFRHDLGASRHAQIVAPAQPTFDETFLYVSIGFLAGSLVIGTGEAITRQVGGDPLGWQIAGVLLNGASTVYNSVIMAEMLGSIQDPVFQALFWASLIASGIGFLMSVVQLMLQIQRRTAVQEKPKAVSVLPWADFDPQGHPRAGLALVGHF